MASEKIQTQISKKLDSLVGQRFNKKTLEAKLSEIFGTKTKVEDISKKESELTDYNFVCEFDNIARGLYGYVDIYFLKMRRKSFDGTDFYVTETAIEFE